MNIKELKQWMQKECFNDNTFSILQEPPYFQGNGLRVDGNKFIWYYTERGNVEDLKSFDDEMEACEYAFNKMKNDKTARSHLVGFLENEQLKDEICGEIENRNIEFQCDKIHYQEGVYKYRIFVYGCDWKKVVDLIR